jgi:hypothetical protein
MNQRQKNHHIIPIRCKRNVARLEYASMIGKKKHFRKETIFTLFKLRCRANFQLSAFLAFLFYL